MTSYHVLSIDGDTAKLVGTALAASSAEGAIRKHAERAGANAGGSYVAVPSRSSKPTKVAVETQTVIRLDGSANGKPKATA